MPITDTMLSWYEADGRHDLPWRKTRDPYRILVSELMLQQTQVSRVIPKYAAFLNAFPTVEALASAERKDVLMLWQGLGYNSRAVRLHALAKLVVSEHGGALPATYEGLLALPGIGPYTAGAVMIFAHDKAAPSVDVNVARVVRRLLFAPEQRPGKKEIEGRALQLLRSSGRPHDWHSALMDFGSAICTSQRPACSGCPLYTQCKSRGPRADEATAKQPAFKGSNRWWRGRIMKLLIERPHSRKELVDSLSGEEIAVENALASMLKDGTVREERDMLSV